MAHITYTDSVTVVPAAWLNDVDTVTYTYFGNGTTLTGNLTLPSGKNITLSGGGTIAGATISSLTGPTTISGGLTVSSGGIAITGNSTITGTLGGVSTLTASTSVLTPLVISAAATDLSLAVNGGAIQWVISSVDGRLRPANDNGISIGDATHRVLSVFTPIIDSGTTGSLSLRTNNGTEQLRITHSSSAVNFPYLTGQPTGVNPQIGSIFSGDTNAGIDFFTKGSGSLNFFTRGDVASKQQFQIIDTASANRNITVTGSNGGNPTIGVTAGNLAITPIVVPTALVDISGAGAGQVKFPSTQNASANTNTLDDYSEGTWTPSVGGSATYTTQVGTFTKIGRLVFIQGEITINAIGTGSTTTISGLPFTNAGGNTAISVVSLVSSVATVVSVGGMVAASGTTLTFPARTAAAASDSVIAIFQNATLIRFAGCYHTTT